LKNSIPTTARLDEVLTEPRAFLELRLLNQDSAGLAGERLDANRLGDLTRWYMSQAGGDQGLMFVQRLPLWKAWLEHISPPLEPSQPGYGRTIGGIHYCAGLVAGAFVLERLEDEGRRAELLTIDAVLDGLAREPMRPAVLMRVPREVAAGRLFEALEELVRLAPEVDLLLQACWCNGVFWCRGPQVQGINQPWAELFFYAGLVCAGARARDPHFPCADDGEGGGASERVSGSVRQSLIEEQEREARLRALANELWGEKSRSPEANPGYVVRPGPGPLPEEEESPDE